MAEQSGERRVTAETCQNLASLMVPYLDPELVQLILSHTASSTSGGRANHDGKRDGDDKDQTTLLREQMGLLMLIRDAGIDRAQLSAMLGLSPEPLPGDDDNPHLPTR